MPIGFDVGTYNLVCCKRDEKGNFENKWQVNAFLEIPLKDDFLFNMMRTAKDPVPLIEVDGMAYAIGEKAVKMAYTMSQLELKRPMKDGCVNPKERDAFQILNTIIHSLLDNVSQDKEILYYCVPANAINEETDAEYHGKLLEAIFKAFKSDEGYVVDPRPINEGLALVYAELGDKNFTGFGISFGAGMVNVCFAIFGAPVFSFALVNSGDWIDKMAAKATGESTTFINKEKTKVNLATEPKSLIERAIQTQYQLMIQHTVEGIKKGLEANGKKARLDQPADVIIAGGTSSPPGFDTLFAKVLKEANLSMEIGEIIRPEDPLFSVARGCLIAAEHAKK